MRRTIIKIIILWWMSLSAAYAQDIQVTAGSLSSCASEIVVPVTIRNANDIAAISMILRYDGQVLVYKSSRSLNSALSNGISAIHGTNGSFVFSWVSTTKTSIPDGTLVELVFTTNGGYSGLTWSTMVGDCEFTDVNGQIKPSSYTNGAISSAGQVASLITQPQNFAAIEGVNKALSFTVYGVATAQWQVSTNNGSTWTDLTDGSVYSGARSTYLTFLTPALSLSGNYYRCIFAGACPPPDTTNQVKISVLSKATLTAHGVNSCANEISIPITVTGFKKIGAFSLALDFDTTKLNYISFSKVSSLINTNDLLVNRLKNQIFIAWASTSPLTMSNNDTLMVLKMFTYGQPNTLAWNSTGSNCEVADENGNKLEVLYNNATISSPGNPPSIYNQPSAVKIYAGKTGNLFVNANSVVSYRWQLSTDKGGQWSDVINNSTYSGVNSWSLQLTNVSLAMNQNWYRCICDGPCPSPVTSKEIVLTVEPAPLTILTKIPTMSFCSENISVPVLAEDFFNASSISLVLNYDSTAIQFTGVSKLHPALKSGMVVANAFKGKINFSWVSVTPADIGKDTLFYLDFHAKSGSTQLSWDLQTAGNCEFSDAHANVILSQFTNGTITIDTSPFTVSISGLANQYCSNEAAVTLTGIPAGGQFNGPGISGLVFNPSKAGPGNHQITYSYQNSQGCLFHVVQLVKIGAVYEMVSDIQICAEKNYTWRGNTYTKTGKYYDSLKSSLGCDSIYVLNLLVSEKNLFVQTAEIKNGETYRWRNKDFTVSGIYNDTVSHLFTCDTIYQLNLTVLPPVFLKDQVLKPGFEVFGTSTHQIQVEFSDFAEGEKKIVVFNALGQQMVVLNTNSCVTLFDTRFTPGIYLVKVMAKGLQATRKVAVK